MIDLDLDERGEAFDSQIASDFADREGEKVERWDRRMNLAITVVIVMAAAAAIFWPVR